MLVQGAAQRHIEHLGAAADAEHRHASPQRLLQEGELPAITVTGRGIGGRVGLMVVGAGIDIAPAGDDQPVDAVEYARGDIRVDGLRRQQCGDPTGPHHALQIGIGQKAGVDVPHSGLCLLQIGGQADHRSGRYRGVRGAQSHALSPNRSPRS